ncbi:ArsA-related P-loop ATPase [Streptomyces sp. Vc17.3-30]|uniref:ArsA-related P-loop ATPase n=1 Tax=Streptomyces sp. Vc17.3-30 TaxID=2841672 RepID=UPI0027E46899|nr:ArsA-related P-loop ATPase [Streptomyces sp. Vc17.3-30]
MRTVLVTGPGGAGRTTLAAATARAAARTGTRVLLLTADPGDRPLRRVPAPGRNPSGGAAQARV